MATKREPTVRKLLDKTRDGAVGTPPVCSKTCSDSTLSVSARLEMGADLLEVRY